MQFWWLLFISMHIFVNMHENEKKFFRWLPFVFDELLLEFFVSIQNYIKPTPAY